MAAVLIVLLFCVAYRCECIIIALCIDLSYVLLYYYHYIALGCG